MKSGTHLSKFQQTPVRNGLKWSRTKHCILMGRILRISTNCLGNCIAYPTTIVYVYVCIGMCVLTCTLSLQNFPKGIQLGKISSKVSCNPDSMGC
jgi:hypothetical protein